MLNFGNEIKRLDFKYILIIDAQNLKILLRQVVNVKDLRKTYQPFLI